MKVTVPTSGAAVFDPGSITHYHALSPAEELNLGKSYSGISQLLKPRSYALNTLYVPVESFLRGPLLSSNQPK
ncbi:hypothetical protein [Pseudomonas sp. GM84]|uniref:hypothetical protein n=1 Tax=Pseudomonas sp. GM84 TaxID=1144340 RepID=UPI0012F84EF4|nr:hypothetical protein [Pseudomonas sp. GM84]